MIVLEPAMPDGIFDKRLTSPARAKLDLPFKPLQDSTKEFEIRELLSGSPLTDDRVLYVHLPFCIQNCSFCGYYKEINCHTGLIDQYISLIAGQLKMLSAYSWIRENPFKAIYFGGGSPSSLNIKQISFLLETVKRFVPHSPNTEFTMELTVNDVSTELVKQLVNLGINRMSIGVQSFNTPLRQKLGRYSTGELAQQAIMEVSNEGITNLCIDLIYNLPGQTLSLWESDLKIVSELPVTGCSVYPLIPFPNSSMVQSGHFIPQSAEEDYQYFKLADDYLLSLGNWTAFTPVQFGHLTLGQPHYITAQGRQLDLLAIGPSAGGRINQYQYLSRYNLATCLSKDFEFLLNSTWSSIHPDYLKLRHLFSLSEGSGISEQDLIKTGLAISDLLPDSYRSFMIDSHNDIHRLSQRGRFWAGNVSELITRIICKKLST
jgi:oxygen-independent coproporphyrinogen-3 oxidase